MQIPRARILDKNIFQLDVLRGVAVLLVMSFHFFEGFSFGWVGVDLFFVLSGFLITGKLVESLGSPGYLSAFYLKRILRIVPLYFLVLLFFFLALPVMASSYISESMRLLLLDQIYYWTFTVNFVEAVKGWPLNISLIHFWSLACEMQFYLVWPFVVLWITRRSHDRLWALWGLIILAVLFRCFIADILSLHLVSKYVLLFSRVDAFSVGALSYFFLPAIKRREKNIALMIAGAALAIIIIMSFAFDLNWHYTNMEVQMVGYTLNAFFWGGLLLWFCLVDSSRNFPTRLLATCGKYSYAMYVFHLPVWIFLQRFAGSSSFSFSLLWMRICAFIFTFLLAFLSYYLYEKHFLKMKPAFKHA